MPAGAAVYVAQDAMTNPAAYAYKVKKIKLAWSLVRGWLSR